ncbi:Hypothetical predicted protein [Lynx pardinus]|uniref:Uncharacterized protein n=1 Tax=Lynx pardinus TaxID=191816 RepID=A0A485NLZ9_LYNPA|nr:Hypothetical predicted protein [Lynx pardinus]
MKQFDVNLLWSQMRQTPRAPVARRRLAAPTASRTPAASGRGTLSALGAEPKLRASRPRDSTPYPRPGETEAR